MKSLEKTPAPVETLLLICEKCGKKLIQDDQDNPASSIQKNLKLKIKQELPLGTARAITTSCMNVCPTNAITVAKISISSKATDAQFYILHEKGTEEGSNLLFKQLITGE